MFLLYISYVRLPMPPVLTPQIDPPYYNQYEVFRDMEPDSQTRVNAWTGFLQEDVTVNRAGPIGNFKGKVDDPRGARLYMVT